mmetsp:Transcript_104082/g.293503  ORF Transcript_104082/g.293503 Transcript_104082/m.293503 type:complete len:335 (+) Transcript_104082:201-1205(+)
MVLGSAATATLIGAAALFGLAGARDDRPIIGILTQPFGTESGTNASAEGISYIAASYVKLVESGGARVAPIYYDSSDAELQTMFSQINGLIFPGGGTQIKRTPTGNRFREAAQLLFDHAVASSEQGDPFPIYGICLGMQLLTLLTAQDDSVLCSGCFNTEGTPLPLELASDAMSSTIFSTMPASLLHAVATQNITANFHHDGVEPVTFERSNNLRDFYRVLSTSRYGGGLPFVSTMEARRFPIMATQWHPEKNIFEWRSGEGIPHRPEAVRLTQHMANHFVDIARTSSHRFHSQAAEARALIYNFEPVPDPDGYFMQVYLWNASERRKSDPIVV